MVVYSSDPASESELVSWLRLFLTGVRLRPAFCDPDAALESDSASEGPASSNAKGSAFLPWEGNFTGELRRNFFSAGVDLWLEFKTIFRLADSVELTAARDANSSPDPKLISSWRFFFFPDEPWPWGARLRSSFRCKVSRHILEL